MGQFDAQAGAVTLPFLSFCPSNLLYYIMSCGRYSYTIIELILIFPPGRLAVRIVIVLAGPLPAPFTPVTVVM